MKEEENTLALEEQRQREEYIRIIQQERWEEEQQEMEYVERQIALEKTQKKEAEALRERRGY